MPLEDLNPRGFESSAYTAIALRDVYDPPREGPKHRAAPPSGILPALLRWRIERVRNLAHVPKTRVLRGKVACDLSSSALMTRSPKEVRVQAHSLLIPDCALFLGEKEEAQESFL